MKAEDVDKMDAGREMDALIAEKVMGWIWCIWVHTYTTPPYPYGQRLRFLGDPNRYSNWLEKWDSKEKVPVYTESEEYQFPCYSTDIAAAWQVVERLCERTYDKDIHIEHLDDEWSVSTCHGNFAPLGTDGWRDFSSANTAPLAICRAALKAHLAAQEPEGAGK